jgi:hypothetical protein
MPIKEEKFYLGNKKLPTPSTQFEWTPEMLAEIEICKKNLLHFAENHFYIINVDEGRQKIKLYKFQKRVLRALRDNRFVICTASRQIGKSTLLTIFALWLACFFDDQHILILANKEDTAIELLSRVRLAFEMLPNHLKPGVKNFSKTLIELGNGSQIKASTTSADSGRGQSISCLIVDEMAYVEDLDRFFQSVYPTISSSKKAKIFAVSTPNGKNNLFYKLFDGAKNKESEEWNGWHPEKVDWFEVPGRDDKWKQITLKTIGSEKAFKIEFENYFEDQSGETQFGKEVIDLLKTKTTTPLEVFDDGKGIFKLWEPAINEHVYSIGVDVGEGIGKNASTVDIIDITDLSNIKQVANYTTNKTEPSFFAIKILQIAKKWGDPPLLVERNNHGGIVIDVLWNTYHYKNLVTYIPNAGEASSKYYERKGIMSHTNSKYNAITNMRYYVGEKRSVQINDIDTIKEYENFKKRANGTWGCDEAHTDDHIYSLMWALFLLDPKINKDFFVIEETDPQGKPLKMIPNFDTYIKPNDMIFPAKRFGLQMKKDQNDYGKYRFLPTSISGGNPNSDINDLAMQGWKPLNSVV